MVEDLISMVRIGFVVVEMMSKRMGPPPSTGRRYTSVPISIIEFRN
jgi:hypothetical protein